MSPALTPAGPWRQLLAALYDSLLLTAVLFLAMALLLILGRGQMPTQNQPLLSLYLLAVAFLFFGGFWTHGGQTLGMRAWKLQLRRLDGGPVDWRQSLLRFLTALPAWLVLIVGVARTAGVPLHSRPWLESLNAVPGWLILGIGLIWLWWDHRPGNWRSRLSGTEVYDLREARNG